MSKTNIAKAIKHLKKDKILKEIISDFSKPVLKKGRDYFGSLVSSIIYQQLSGKAAGTIESRFRALFVNGNLLPEKVLKLKDIQFRSVGLSGQKMRYLRDLSSKFLSGVVDTKKFHKMTDGEIREHLVSVKGIGTWTADMFLIFTLNRLDVLPTGDLGIQKGFKKVFNLRGLSDAKKMQKLAKNWQPYRTVACLYLWKVADKDK